MSANQQLPDLINSIETDLGIEANAPVSTKKQQTLQQQSTKKEKKVRDKRTSHVVDVKTQPEITKLDLRVGQITKVWKHETAAKLYCEEIDVGEEKPREIASGLVYHYSLEDMQKARRVVVLCNLKPRNLMGFRSHGMVMCAAVTLENGEEKVAFVTPPDDAKIGERITFRDLSGEPFSPAQVEKKKVLTVLGNDMMTDDNGVAKWKDYEFCTSAGPCTAFVKNGIIR